MAKLFLFDIDGTILKFTNHQSRSIFSDALNTIFKISSNADELPSFAGKTDAGILHDIKLQYSIPEKEFLENSDKLKQIICTEFELICNLDNIVLCSGILEFIDYLLKNNKKLSLLTGNFKRNAYTKLRIHGLDSFFPVGAFGDNHINRNNLGPLAVQSSSIHYHYDFIYRECLIIGDSPLDIACGKHSNIPVLAIATGEFGYEELEHHYPDYLLNNLTEIDRFKNIFLR